uniref:Uncharacterized protein LOC111115673 n=1 Tax=Crassostrea virginica TaxID=6565 RepID=A0A8B8C3E7_CRAVI|nr:uncharacterized protein LOC111115673 [Crassostrea virginica]
MKMYSVLFGLVGVCLVSVVRSQEPTVAMDMEVVCKQCKGQGSCDVPVPGQCVQYYRCQQVENNWYVEKMNCAHGTHFSEATGGCLKPSDANCPYDPCRNETSGFYKLEGFCRSYWECKLTNRDIQQGISEAHCCPINQTFSPEGKCVDDPNCDNLEECTTLSKDLILNDVVCPEGKYGPGCRYMCSEHCIGICDSVNGECSSCAKGWMGSKCMEECRYKSVADNKYHYMEVVGEREYKRACGLGTQFNQEKCICDKDPSYIINKACTPDVEVAFESGNQIKNTIDWKWIGGTFKSTSETAQYGEKVYKVGRFDGTSSNLYIPFYNRNTEMRKTFATEIVFNPDNGKGNKRQVLLSNCQNVASTAAPFEITLLKDTQDIQISLEAGSNMVAGAEPSQTYTITMKYKPDDWNKLEVVFNGEKNLLTARNLDLTGGVISDASTAVSSFLENGLDLRVGWCPDKGYFVGKMATVRTYLCEPQFNLDVQPIAEASTGSLNVAAGSLDAGTGSLDTAAGSLDVAVTEPPTPSTV